MNWKPLDKQKLVQAFLELKTADDVQRFLRDILTESEIEEFAKRLQAAELLASQIPYSQIIKKTGLSSTTVARVSKYLNGKEGGYRQVLSVSHQHTPSGSGRALS